MTLRGWLRIYWVLVVGAIVVTAAAAAWAQTGDSQTFSGAVAGLAVPVVFTALTVVSWFLPSTDAVVADAAREMGIALDGPFERELDGRFIRFRPGYGGGEIARYDLEAGGRVGASGLAFTFERGASNLWRGKLSVYGPPEVRAAVESSLRDRVSAAAADATHVELTNDRLVITAVVNPRRGQEIVATFGRMAALLDHLERRLASSEALESVVQAEGPPRPASPR